MKQLRIFFLCLVAATLVTACGGDDPIVPELPNHDKGGTEEGEKPEITPDQGITLYGLVKVDSRW